MDVSAASPGTIDRWTGILPGCLLELWTVHGFGSYGGGLIQLVDPADYAESLGGWLGRAGSDDRVPIALTAFGTMLYYRRLGQEGEHDIAYIDPHRAAAGVVSWDAESFFNETLLDDGTAAPLLDRALFDAVKARLGPPDPGEMYCFVPALRLGGGGAADSVQRVNAAVHLDILLQLVQGGSR